LTYDLQNCYTYNAWNRLVGVYCGDSTNNPQIATLKYDGLGRRISKVIDNRADQGGQWVYDDPTWSRVTMVYEYYYNGQSLIETRNGSNQALKQHVWGLTYIDELLQIGINYNPSTDNTCLDEPYYALQDANFNVLGIVDTNGDLDERYEYTPYGQRTIYTDASGDDNLCMAPILESQRKTVDLSTAAYGICDIGHQGLMHDKEFGLIYNRARYLSPKLGRFLQRDPMGYVDGMNLYEYVGSGPVTYLDPPGKAAGAAAAVAILLLGMIGCDEQQAPPVTSPGEAAAIRAQRAFEDRVKARAKARSKMSKPPCSISRSGKRIGFLSADRLFYHVNRTKIVKEGDADWDKATGVGIALNFVAYDDGKIGKPPLCCDDYRFIQVVTTNIPGMLRSSRDTSGYVDVREGRTLPFYGARASEGRSEYQRGGRAGGPGAGIFGTHKIPPGFPGAGREVAWDRSMYDSPYRTGKLSADAVHWMAETCVVCVRKGKPDIVLDCIDYGFTQGALRKDGTRDHVVAEEPLCSGASSPHFQRVVTNDRNVKNYHYGKECTDKPRQ